VSSPSDWLRHKEVLRQRFLDLIRDAHRPAQPPLDLRVHEGVDIDGCYERRLISYAVEDGERAHAFLALPHHLTAPAPAIVSLHGTYPRGKERDAGLEGEPEKAFLDQFARRGYVVIAPDHFVAGERIPPEGPYDTARFHQKHPQWTAVGKSVYEHAIALDMLETLPEVDPARLGTFGHSLGGHGACFLAAYDARVCCAASNSGCAPFRHNSRVEAWARDHFYVYFSSMREGLLRGELPPIDLHEIMALIAPRPFLDLSALNDLIAGDEPRLAGWTYRQRVLMLMKVMDVYELEDAPGQFAFYSHGRGHAAPHEARELIHAWFDQHLLPPAATAPRPVPDVRCVRLGLAAAVSESRGVAAVRTPDGRALVLTLLLDMSELGSLLVTDVDSGETTQVPFPAATRSTVWAQWAPYASLLSRAGCFYTFAGPTLLEFDPTSLAFSFHGVPAPEESCYVETAMVEGPDGRIYAASHPHARLVSYDPATREMRDHGQLDPAEHYPNSLAMDEAGWLYAGIGTARAQFVAYHPPSGEIRPLLNEADRPAGSARVRPGTDGAVYGEASDQVYRLRNGGIETIDTLPAVRATAAGRFQNTIAALPDGRRATVHLPEQRLVVTTADGKTEREVTLTFQSGGALISSLGLGPDGLIYGSTAHPMHLFRYDPAAREIADLGAIPAIGGGNICTFAVQQDRLYGPSYPHGDVYAYDPALPFTPEQATTPNPGTLVNFAPHLTRPRTCLAHPDGVHVVVGGFMDYGRVGGGLGLINTVTGESTLLPPEVLLPGHSTITLAALTHGDLVGGTSVLAPGGGHTTATEGLLYLMDWNARRLVLQIAPIPGATEITSLAVSGDGLVYGIATGARFFVFDPIRREVIDHTDLSAWGDNVRPGLIRGPNGTVYGLLSHHVFRIDPGEDRPVKIAALPRPATAGLALHDGHLYYAAQAELWRVRL